MLSEEYEKALKARVIREFLGENQRAPSKQELLAVMNRQKRRYATLDSGGFASFDAQYIGHQEQSSASKENALRAAAFEDLRVVDQKLRELQESLDMNFRGLYATASRVSRGLDALEARLDNLILLNESSDLFTYGVEESFDTQEHVDWSNTTASVESKYCTIGRAGYSSLDLQDLVLTSSVTSDKGYLSVQGAAALEHLKSNDGVFWEQLVYTDYSVGRVSLVLDMDLQDPRDVTAFRFSCSPVQVNGELVSTLYYSVDGKNYDVAGAAERPIMTSENEFLVDVQDVLKLRLVLTKRAADGTVASGRQHMYVFSLDSLAILLDGFAPEALGVLQAGPYEVLDEEGQVVNFTRATCETCGVIPSGTSVSMYLSNDGENWIGVSGDQAEGSAVVVFESSALEDLHDLEDPASGENNLVEEVQGIDLLQASDVALNAKVKSEYRTRLIKKTVVLKRNVLTGQEAQEVLGAPPGWRKLPDGQLQTTIYVGNPEGLTLDLGHTSAFVNDNAVQGLVYLSPGYQVFRTSPANFQEIESGARDIKELRQRDPLYPYNHRYLVEGYGYSGSFTGEIMYPGVSEYFGTLLRYVAPEEFADPENHEDLGIFTIDESTETLVFKIKTLKSDSSWRDELVSVSWLVSGTLSSRIWAKAILRSTTSTRSPVLESFKIRVI